MSKTEETKLLEDALHQRQIEKREYGCEEVTIGFKAGGKGDEIVDYMTMDASDQFRCYEIKVTLSDLRSDNALSFYGDYNYLVVSDSLYLRNPVWENHIPPYAGILCGKDLRVIRQAKLKRIDEQTRQMLKSSLLRSVCWKYENHRNAQILNDTRALIRQMEQMKQEYQNRIDELDQMEWTCHDFEYYYGANHQITDFHLEKEAVIQRKQYALRKEGRMSWTIENGELKCPVCGNHQNQETPYCPYCGTDLKKMKEHE